MLQIVGRRSSHFTRVALIFAHELDVQLELVPIYDMTTHDADVYAGNPALKLPTLRRDGSLVFGCENICRALAEVARPTKTIVWPEMLRDDRSRNAQELTWHGMSAQVQLVLGTGGFGKLPADNVYFAKMRKGFEGALRWLDDNAVAAIGALPEARALSLLEVTLFCLVEHLKLRPTIALEAYPSLVQFAQGFSARASAESTQYLFDARPAAG